MARTELPGNSDGYVLCPLRGEVSAEWCEGCPFRMTVDRSGDRPVVVCDPSPGPAHPMWWSPLRDLPDIWK